MGQGVVEESAAESSGGLGSARPPACYVEQEVTTQEMGQPTATNLVQRPRASTAGPHAEEQAAHGGGCGPGLEGPVCSNTTLETSTREEQSSAAQMLKEATQEMDQPAVAARACPDLTTIVVEEAAAQDEPGMAEQTGGGNIPADLTELLITSKFISE